MEHPAIDRAFEALFPEEVSGSLEAEKRLERILAASFGDGENHLILGALCEGATFYAGTRADERKLCRVRDHIDSLLGMDVEWDEIGLIPSLLREEKSFPEIRRTLLQAALKNV